MKSVTWRFWILYQVAAFPLALFCWYATLFWLAVVLFHALEETERMVWPLSPIEIAGAVGFWSFGVVHLLGLWFGARARPGLRWLLLAVPVPWLVSFLLRQFDDDLSYPGDGLLPPGLQGPAAVTYLVVLLAILSAALIVALAEAVGHLTARAKT